MEGGSGNIIETQSNRGPPHLRPPPPKKKIIINQLCDNSLWVFESKIVFLYFSARQLSSAREAQTLSNDSSEPMLQSHGLQLPIRWTLLLWWMSHKMRYRWRLPSSDTEWDIQATSALFSRSVACSKRSVVSLKEVRWLMARLYRLSENRGRFEFFSLRFYHRAVC